MLNESIIVIGNKPYKQLQLNKIIDEWDKNIRCNFGLPSNNNGTKYYDHFLNVHCYINVIINNMSTMDTYKRCIDLNYLEYFKKNFNKRHYKKIYRQNNNHKRNYNIFLKNIQCPYIFKKHPRCGCNAVFEHLLHNKHKIYITHFNINNTNKDKYSHRYVNESKLKKKTSCHDVDNEVDILIWLHNNNYIDVTLSILEDTEIPTCNCIHVKPSLIILTLILTHYDKIILLNYTYDLNDLNELNDSNDFIIEKNDDNIILKKHNI